MSPEGKRKFNTLMGSLFLGIGLISWGVAAYVASTPAAARPTPTVGAPSVDLNSCRQALTRLRYSAEIKGGEILVKEPVSESADDDAVRNQLQKATIGSSMCRLSLKSFCMGEACEFPGQLSFVLSKNRIVVEEEKGVSPVLPQKVK